MGENPPFDKYDASVDQSRVSVGDSDSPRYIEQGAESHVRQADIAIIEDGEIIKEIKDGFVRLRPSDELKKINPDFAEKRFERMEALKSINREQSKNHGHVFTLPNTVRLVIEKDGTKSLLETDVTQDGKLDMIDLKNFKGYQFDEETYNFITETIRKDVALAAEHGIALSRHGSIHAPLDTWHLVTNPETGDKKLYILDVGFSVAMDQSQEELDASIQKIETVLQSVQRGSETKRTGPAFEELDDETVSL